MFASHFKYTISLSLCLRWIQKYILGLFSKEMSDVSSRTAHDFATVCLSLCVRACDLNSAVFQRAQSSLHSAIPHTQIFLSWILFRLEPTFSVAPERSTRVFEPTQHQPIQLVRSTLWGHGLELKIRLDRPHIWHKIISSVRMNAMSLIPSLFCPRDFVSPFVISNFQPL